MGDYVEGIKESTKESEKMLSVEKQITAELQKHVALEEKKAKASRSGSASQIANHSSTTSPTANNGGGTNGYNNGPNPYSADQAGPYSGGTASKPPRFSGLGTTIAGFAETAAKTAMSLVNFLPTVEEATSAQLMKSRMSFYGSAGQFPSKHTPPKSGYYNPDDPARYGVNEESAFRMTRDLTNKGTSLTPSDAQAAINNGIQMGFLPSLKNYGMGASGAKTGFSGILGGAALASNLAPGIGIQGGMQAMGSLNQAQNVNMLKMLGVQVRNSKGTGMNDLPAIIEQIYKLLARGGNITVEDIAESLLPGNALDSMLNQYLGGDANLKNVVIAGLVQRVKSGENLRTSGEKSSLIKSGASTESLRSMSARNASELGLIQKYTDPTANATVAANNSLGKFYSKLSAGKLFGNDVSGAITKAINLSTKLDMYAGARGGAGQQTLSTIFEGAGTGFANSGALGKAIIGGAGIAAAYTAATIDPNQKTTNMVGSEFGNNDFYGSPTNIASASNPGQIYTGSITVNVAAPPGQDPYSYGLAIGQAMTARS
jgi:hypothetical protein